MKKHIKISVIVTVYNLENELERCLDSILQQTHQAMEIIVVDDGSVDNSKNIIEEYVKKDSRIVPVYKQNGGVTSARLAGIKKTTGDYIGFVDGDDEIEANMYEFLLDNAIQYNAEISHCGYQMIFPDGRINCFYGSGCLLEQNHIQGIKDLLSGALVEPGLCNKLYQKKLFQQFQENDLIPSEIKINEDLLMNFYLFNESKKAVFEDRCLYHYLIRRGSATRKSLNKHSIFDPIKVKKIILDNSQEDYINDARKAFVSTCVNVYNTLCLQKNTSYREEKQEVKNIIIEAKKWHQLLSKKQQVLAFLICKISWIYPVIYRIYANTFLNNKYE